MNAQKWASVLEAVEGIHRLVENSQVQIQPNPEEGTVRMRWENEREALQLDVSTWCIEAGYMDFDGGGAG